MGLENRIVYDLVDVVEGRCRLRQALIRDKRVDSLFLLPSAQTRDKSAVNPSDMIRVCDQLRPQFDYMLIDSPAGIEQGYRNAVAPADLVLIVTNPEVSAVRDADRVIGLVEAEGKGSPQLVINRLDPDMVRRGDMLDTADVIEILAIDLLGIVPEDPDILVATNRGQPVALDGRSLAAQAFHNIARRIMGQDIAFLPLQPSGGFFERLRRAFGVQG
jgi:septum site-determining protein MinD